MRGTDDQILPPLICSGMAPQFEETSRAEAAARRRALRKLELRLHFFQPGTHVLLAFCHRKFPGIIVELVVRKLVLTHVLVLRQARGFRRLEVVIVDCVLACLYSCANVQSLMPSAPAVPARVV